MAKPFIYHLHNIHAQLNYTYIHIYNLKVYLQLKEYIKLSRVYKTRAKKKYYQDLKSNLKSYLYLSNFVKVVTFNLAQCYLKGPTTWSIVHILPTTTLAMPIIPHHCP